MKRRIDITNNMMMEMYMQTCSMYMTCRAYFSDVFSISIVNPCAV